MPSLLLNNRIVYLGMPISAGVTELIVSELLYLQYDSNSKPIIMYINSPGTTTEDGQPVGFETEAFAVADTMDYVSAPIHTVLVGKAYGLAAMLLACGEPGQRSALPYGTVMLHQPRGRQAQGQASDIAIQATEILGNRRTALEITSIATGVSIDKLREDTNRCLYLDAQQALDYGIVDKIVTKSDKVRRDDRAHAHAHALSLSRTHRTRQNTHRRTCAPRRQTRVVARALPSPAAPLHPRALRRRPRPQRSLAERRARCVGLSLSAGRAPPPSRMTSAASRAASARAAGGGARPSPSEEAADLQELAGFRKEPALSPLSHRRVDRGYVRFEVGASSSDSLSSLRRLARLVATRLCMCAIPVPVAPPLWCARADGARGERCRIWGRAAGARGRFAPRSGREVFGARASEMACRGRANICRVSCTFVVLFAYRRAALSDAAARPAARQRHKTSERKEMSVRSNIYDVAWRGTSLYSTNDYAFGRLDA